MSGVLNAVVASGSVGVRRVTIAAIGASGYWGYNSGLSSNEPTPAGAISLGSFNGATIYWITSANSAAVDPDFEINLSGTRAKSFFTGVRITDGDGAIRTRLTTNATLQTGAADGGTRWQWSGESTAIWDSADSGEIRAVEFF